MAKWITEIYKIVEILAFSCPGLSPLLFYLLRWIPEHPSLQNVKFFAT